MNERHVKKAGDAAPHLLDATARIVSAYVGNNHVSVSEVSGLINSIGKALVALENGDTSKLQPKPIPAVSPGRSVHDDHIVCLEDGLSFKSLKRHLFSKYGLTPELYRKRWGLPHDYPMVAPAYARVRSKLAKVHGLGANSPLTDLRQQQVKTE